MAMLLCPLPEAGQSASLKDDPVDCDTQLRILRVEITRSGGQALVIHQGPNGLQALSVGQGVRRIHASVPVLIGLLVPAVLPGAICRPAGAGTIRRSS